MYAVPNTVKVYFYFPPSSATISPKYTYSVHTAQGIHTAHSNAPQQHDERASKSKNFPPSILPTLQYVTLFLQQLRREFVLNGRQYTFYIPTEWFNRYKQTEN